MFRSLFLWTFYLSIQNSLANGPSNYERVKVASESIVFYYRLWHSMRDEVNYQLSYRTDLGIQRVRNSLYIGLRVLSKFLRDHVIQKAIARLEALQAPVGLKGYRLGSKKENFSHKRDK
jgi:hypothetical protein